MVVQNLYASIQDTGLCRLLQATEHCLTSSISAQVVSSAFKFAVQGNTSAAHHLIEGQMAKQHTYTWLTAPIERDDDEIGIQAEIEPFASIIPTHSRPKTATPLLSQQTAAIGTCISYRE